MGRGFLWCVTVGNAVLGSALTVASLLGLARADGPSRGLMLLSAAAGVLWVGAGSVGFHRMYMRRRPLDGARVAREAVGGRPAVVLRWSSTILGVPAATLGGLAAVCAAGTFLQVAGGGAPVTAWLTAGAAVLLLLPLPDCWLRLRRRPWLALTAEGVVVHGWDGDGGLDWDQVAGVELVDAGFWTTMRVVARPGVAPRWRRRRRVLFAPRPRGPYVEVPLPVLDVDPFFLAGTIELYARNPAVRREIADGLAVTRLVQRIRPFPDA